MKLKKREDKMECGFQGGIMKQEKDTREKLVKFEETVVLPFSCDNCRKSVGETRWRGIGELLVISWSLFYKSKTILFTK